jgi:hypothetical protein
MKINQHFLWIQKVIIDKAQLPLSEINKQKSKKKK